MRNITLSLLILCSSALSAAESWEFPNAEGTGEDLLQLQHMLNPAEAGIDGWLRRSADGNDIIDSNGKRMRFWSVSSGIDNEHLPAQSKWLASLGVNMVRIAGHTLSPRAKDADPMQPEQAIIEGVWRMVAEHKKNGIYCMLTPYWVAKGSDVSNWGIDGYTGNRKDSGDNYSIIKTTGIF